jgi:dienelactone hydrolase
MTPHARCLYGAAAFLLIAACGDPGAGAAPDTGADADAGDALDDAHDPESDAAADTRDGDHGGDAATDDDRGDRDGDSAEPDTTDATNVADGADAADAPGDAADTTDAVADVAADTLDDVDAGPPPLFDMAMIADPTTADCRFENQRSVLDGLQRFDVWDVSFNSWESIDGELLPIRMRGYAARPGGRTGIPGLVNMHGLGGYAKPENATGPAALLGYFTIAPTGPGGGTEASNTSEGRPAGFDAGYRMFDTVTDLRGSWFWAHAVTAMRAVTCLEEHPAVDADRIGMTGYSAGAVVTLISAGVDERIGAAVPLSGTGAWEETMESPNAWQHALLTQAGLTMASPEWLALNENLDPARVVAGARTPILMVNGSTDEFFALNAHLETYDAIPGEVAHRTSIAANVDHGCFSLTGLEDASSIEERAVLHAEGAQKAWFHHHFGTDADFAYLPIEPAVSVSVVGAATVIDAVVDPGGSRLVVDEVRFWYSVDNALIFLNETLDEVGGGHWGKIVAAAMPANGVWFVDVTYRTDDLIGADRFTLSSRPHLPDAFVPNVRSITSCLP